ncbi:MAG: thioredoxin [Bacteroidales bacterium]|nr:thioredoxin [Bacteroidales bacterium]
MISTAKIFEVNKTNFEKEVIQNKVPVVLEFGASWCGPCHIIAPIMEELAIEYDRIIKFCKLDTDENAEIKEKYGISDLPTILLLNNGSVADIIVGTKPKSEIKMKIDNLLNSYSK